MTTKVLNDRLATTTEKRVKDISWAPLIMRDDEELHNTLDVYTDTRRMTPTNYS